LPGLNSGGAAAAVPPRLVQESWDWDESDSKVWFPNGVPLCLI